MKSQPGMWENAAVVVKHSIKERYKVHEDLVPYLKDIRSLNPHPENPRNGDVEKIRQSLEDHGQYVAIVINRGTYSRRYDPDTIAKGNHTYMGALENRWTHIAATYIDVDDDELDRIMLVDNAVSDSAWNDEGLVLELIDRIGHVGTGIDASDVDIMRERQGPLEFNDDVEEGLGENADIPEEPMDESELPDPADDTPDLPREPKTSRGEVWILGDHRVMCGDSTNVEDIKKLLGPHKMVELIVTSPPYGVGKEYESGFYQDWLHLMRGWTKAWQGFCKLAAVNLADLRVGPDHREWHSYGDFLEIATENGFPLIGTRIWSKPPAWFVGPYYTSSYRSVDEWEYLCVLGKAPYISRLTEEDDWRYRGIWKMASVNKNDNHPAKFPVELPRRFARLLTDEKQRIADPFLGSGTTILAAQETGRVGFGMELQNKYVDVTLERFWMQTGIEPRREGDDKSWNDLKNEE